MEKMQEYDFIIKYLPGKQNVVADAVSRRPDLQLNSVFSMVASDSLKATIKASLASDPDFHTILDTLHGKPVTPAVPSSLMHHYSISPDGMLLYDETRLCIPVALFVPRFSMITMMPLSRATKALNALTRLSTVSSTGPR
jgi:hypothetical protein